ncbi:hypothetical protein UFOVP822_34 [uncultured Caudovirales phage]|uniref:Uncharacterized protein n=1 Tax=uncultured Caudovirales phage TaxID=2100421 RepID=A0A6J5P8A8_9CAUD|nr:hypothetical protein UFOVP822_34 [uncultured Caudovirales phage]
MISDDELNKIIAAHGYVSSTTPHWAGCYQVHAECAVRWLVATVRELSPVAAKRLGTTALAEETREKELVKFMELFLELMRITMSDASTAYLEAHRIIRDIKGLPPEDVIYPPRRKKKPAGSKPPKIEHNEKGLI